MPLFQYFISRFEMTALRRRRFDDYAAAGEDRRNAS